MSLHTPSGKINTTTVVGSSTVSLHAGDGGINVIIDDVTSKGIHHPSGAIRVNSGTSSSYYDSTGAAYSNHLFGPGK